MAYGTGVFRAPLTGRGFQGTTSSGGPGGLAGASPRDYNPASGGVPGVTSPISTVMGNLGDLTGLQQALTGSAATALRGQYPDQYFANLATLMGNVGRRAAGDISDLLPELQQGAAEAAVAGGVSGSQAENTKLLRDLGLTRYGVENQALQDQATLQREIPTVQPQDISSLIAAQLQAQQMADIYRSAPSPEAAYQRAAGAARVGAGGGGAGGVSYRPPIGGGGSVDDILSRYGHNTGGYGPPLIVKGTGEMGPLTYGKLTADEADQIYGSQYGELTPEEAEYIYGPDATDGDGEGFEEY